MYHSALGLRVIQKRISMGQTCREREIGRALVGLFFAGGDCFGGQESGVRVRVWGLGLRVIIKS